jgi:heptosyltransferase-2
MPEQFLVVQTAFLGDVVLTLPLIQVLKRSRPASEIDIVVIPAVADVLVNNPCLREVIVFDKKEKEKGISGLLKLAKKLQTKSYDVALVPHRSLRSAVLTYRAKIKRRIGFNTSSGSFLLHEKVVYDSSAHEVKRNLSLLCPLGIEWKETEYPSLYPSAYDKEVVTNFLTTNNLQSSKGVIAIAPGTRWNTKRWLNERYSELAACLRNDGFSVVLIGGTEDVECCREIVSTINTPGVISSAGKFSILQSAELIRRCAVFIGNDSAPMHLAVAMRTPVVAIFGATVPAFGFAPYGPHDVVVETNGLSCRPCSIHGGKRCPIRTFDCMVKITVHQVLQKIYTVLSTSRESDK